ncbi:MAG: PIN domain-containing protein [Luteolibacter sp.]
MKRFLPDVNALLALLDPMHVHHEAAHQWYAAKSPLRLLTCSHLENGVIQVASQPKYPNCLGTSGKVRKALQDFVQKAGAESCEHDISLLDDEILLIPGLLTPSRVADLYLLALAACHDARLATFDRRIPAEAVSGGVDALEVIPVPAETGG